MAVTPSERVRRTAQCIASNPASHVKVDEAACRNAASFLHDLLAKQTHTYASISNSWCNANSLHPFSASPNSLSWIFVVDTLNFCFWTPQGSPPFAVEYKKQSYTGYWALCAAVNRAIQEDIPITDPSFLATVGKDTVEYIFRSSTDTPIPLLEERVKVLNEAGAVLQEKFGSSVEELVAAAQNSAQRLITTVTSNFKSYDDSLPLEAYSSRESLPPKLGRLCFYKRAQILVADIWACFASTKRYRFHDIASLTMFADYRVPQTLAWLGAIRYSDSLMQQLCMGDEMAPGATREIEIRACSIHAVELIRASLEALQRKEASETARQDEVVPINSVLIDYLLWDYAKAHKKKLNNVPIHHVKSVYY